ncbi:transmembrane protein C17orf113 homolog [Bufo gargarizans]|uniref:transmembrane protein C17orf113 homolog n=1 Tax=Bufo gargarizans TaxID=30331 RepID=UPI001CF40B35|nr:transmembrane protein C17orf113 homolog [Bufo gargarizans]
MDNLNPPIMFDFTMASGGSMVTPGKKPAGETSNSNKKCKRYFNEHWKEEFTWLEFDYERKLMFCMECRQALVKNKHGKAENAFTVGTDNFQRHALLRHVTSGAHRQALAVNREQLAMEMHFHQELKSVIKAEMDPSKIAILTTVYTMAKDGISSRKLPSLLELQKFNLCEALLSSEQNEYYYPSSVRQMQAAIVKVLHSEDQKRLKDSPFIGLVFDETMDITEQQSLVVFTTSISPYDGQLFIAFLGKFDLCSGDASSVLDKVKDILNDFHVPPKKVAWLGSDGSSLMSDRQNGVGGKLKSICPLVSEFHCISHRRSLLPTECFNSVEYVKKYESIIDAVYRLYGNKNGDSQSFIELHKVLTVCGIDLNCARTFHWTSILPAVETIDFSWPTLVLLLESESAKSPIASGLCVELKKFWFVAFTKVLLDILPIFQKLNQFFQIEDIDISMINPIVTASQATLQAQKSTNGQNFQEFLNDLNEHPDEDSESRFYYKGVELVDCSKVHLKDFELIKEDCLENVCKSLQDRFPSNVLKMISSFSVVFSPKSYPSSLDDIGTYGEIELRYLLQYFSRVLVPERASNDFALFKRIVFSLSHLSFRDLCVKLVHSNSEMHELFPDFTVLAAVALVLPLGSVLFEKISRVKELLKQSCHQEGMAGDLSDVLKIAIDGPVLNDLDFSRAVHYFEGTRESESFVSEGRWET